MNDDLHPDDVPGSAPEPAPASQASQDAVLEASTDTLPADDAVLADPLDDTQPVDVPRYAPTPDPRPDARWAWASPPPQPGADRWQEPESPDGATPPPAFASPMAGAQAQPAARRGAGLGSVILASVLSAVLAAGGTVLLLDRAGAFDATVIAPVSGGALATVGAPVTIDESSAVIDAAARVGPAVVKITTESQSADPFGNVQTEGVGSGVIYDAAGWILTNRHVVADAASLVVELKDGRQFPGTVYGIDTLTDLAIVKVDQTGLPVAPIGKSDGLKVGQLVVAVGSPLGLYSFSVTSGIVSGMGRDIAVNDNTTRIRNLIQTDAAINPGNSGGPLADATGAVVGINTAVATDSSGIGFAIPIDIARPIMEQAVRGEALSRPWIGIRFLTIDLQTKNDLNLPVDNGALVSARGGGETAVEGGSPAATAGILDGDIIRAIDGISLDQEHPLDSVLVRFSPGETVTLDVLRNGAPVQVSVTLGTRPTNM